MRRAKYYISLGILVACMLAIYFIAFRPPYRVVINSVNMYGKITGGTKAVLAAHTCFFPEQAFAEDWLAEYYYSYCNEILVQPTSYIYIRFRPMEKAAYQELLLQIKEKMTQFAAKDSAIYYCTDETIKSLQYFFDDNTYDGAQCFYNIAVVDQTHQTAEIWICFNDDGLGDKNKNFEKFLTSLPELSSSNNSSK